MSEAQINAAVRKQVRSFFRTLTLLFISLLTSVVLFLAAVVIAAYVREPEKHDLDTILLIVAPISSAALMLIANRLFSARVNSAKTKDKLYEKMDDYRAAVILRFMLLDAAAFVPLVAYLLTENKAFLAIGLVVITMFLLYRPGLERFIREMELNTLEAQVMRDHSK
jgi:Na+-transporting NADH:ubiquinone oxidoreductase subunit NqrC